MKYYVTHVWIYFQLQIDSQFLQPTRSKCIHSSVYHSVHGRVRAQRGIWSKRVFMRTNGSFSFSVHWRNTTIIHYILLAKKALDIFEKWSWLYGCRSIQSSPTGLTPWRNSKDQLTSQPIKISYKMTKKRPCTQSGFTKKRTLEQKSC